VLLELPDQLVAEHKALQVLQDQLAHQELLELPDQQELQVHKEFRELQVYQDLQDQLDQQDLVLLVNKELQVFQDQLAHKVYLV
jgi:hypothetical protein